MSSNPLSYLRKESLDIFNRIHSIEEDIYFVRQVNQAYPGVPIIPNLRCGAWYTDPAIATDIPAYFKSTDGHFSNWGFNLRRANLHLLPLIIEQHGIILVDSTRSGKRIPDALSKTVPIWCAVINRAMLILHPEITKTNPFNKWDTALYTPPGGVSMQEHHQIEQRLDSWANSLVASSFSLPTLPCPLRPMWITPATTTFPPIKDESLDFLPIMCVSASKQIQQGLERRSGGFAYIQGSGDDHELWGMGLTPQIFWEHHQDLIAADRAQLSSLVSKIIVSAPHSACNFDKTTNSMNPIKRVGGRLLIGSIAGVSDTVNVDNMEFIILTSSMQDEPISKPRKTYIPVVAGKRGHSQFLRTVLPTAVTFIRDGLAEEKRICIACDSGKDLSVGVALAALQLFFQDNGHLVPMDPVSTLNQGAFYYHLPAQSRGLTGIVANKKSIRTRLEWIIASRPQANPSRATLKRVNEFLLSPPSLWRVCPPSSSPRKEELGIWIHNEDPEGSEACID
ncbi:initiator tRNA phosphoribosyl transferase [Phlegmacium glaucopus]|nr:initiator tRNA phosphoribosyl transferase [Phlegmacium glaucopus]